MIMKHELGLEARDKITGVKGIITSRVEFLTGCNRYCIQPQDFKDGVPVGSTYFDEDQIEVIGSGINAEEVTGKERGACSPDPVK